MLRARLAGRQQSRFRHGSISALRERAARIHCLFLRQDFDLPFDFQLVQTREISGGSSARLSSPDGSDGMVNKLAGSGSSSYFECGDPRSFDSGANWHEFEGSSFRNVSEDEQFLVGQLDFSNGTISLNRVATAVDFSVGLTFDGTTKSFDFSFDLLTPPNHGTAWENADYAWFNDTVSSRAPPPYGADYKLNLEFGETTGDEFSWIDQFHFQEAQAAAAKLVCYHRLDRPMVVDLCRWDRHWTCQGLD